MWFPIVKVYLYYKWSKLKKYKIAETVCNSVKTADVTYCQNKMTNIVQTVIKLQILMYKTAVCVYALTAECSD